MEEWGFSVVTIKVFPCVLSGFCEPYKVMRHEKFLSGTTFHMPPLGQKGMERIKFANYSHFPYSIQDIWLFCFQKHMEGLGSLETLAPLERKWLRLGSFLFLP